jgi:putative DNA primase/helicase
MEEIYYASLILECPDVDGMESGENYINVQNGLLNIDTMQLEEHSKDIFSTVQMPIDYDSKAECPEFMQYLNDVFEGDDDLIKHIQEVMGYCLVRNAKAQKIFMLVGEGSNGKSVLCLLLAALCGKDNVSSVSLRGLSSRFGKSGLVDKNVNISSENELTGENINTEDIKAISAGDPVMIERKFEHSYTANLHTKLIFAVNKLPYLKDNSYGLLRRISIIPFNKTFVENPTKEGQGKKDKFILEKLMAELAGILNFSLEGLKRLQANNYVFTEAQKSLEMLEEYKLEINPYLDFVRAAIVQVERKAEPDKKIDRTTQRRKNPKAEKTEITSFMLKNAFQAWCDEMNHKQLSNTTARRLYKEVRSALKALDIRYTERDSNSNRWFEGIKLTKEYEEKVELFLDDNAPKSR